MHELRSYVGGSWVAGTGAQQTLLNPTTEEPLAQVSSEGVDLGAALRYARTTGGPALRALSFAEAGPMITDGGSVRHSAFRKRWAVCSQESGVLPSPRW